MGRFFNRAAAILSIALLLASIVGIVISLAGGHTWGSSLLWPEDRETEWQVEVDSFCVAIQVRRGLDRSLFQTLRNERPKFDLIGAGFRVFVGVDYMTGTGIKWFHYVHLVQIPLWAPLLVGSIVPLTYLKHAIRRRRWLARGCCGHCGFDLRASLETCPECGAPVSKPSIQRV